MNESLEPAFKRLFDAQHHWHIANQKYFDPNSFRMAINSCIQELRNVTFVLQSNKSGIEGFEEWYSPWQTKMRANKSLKWLISARNYIVKQGDLKLNSVLRIEVVGSYLSGEVTIFEQNHDVNLSNKDILDQTLNKGIPQEVLENSYIKLERKWIDSKYPDHELLELLGVCWTAVSDLLLDAPNNDIKKSDNLNPPKIPPCMYQNSEARSIWLKVEGTNLILSKMHEESITFDETTIENCKQKYGDSPLFDKKQVDHSNFKTLCEGFFEQAQFFLQKDKYHIHLILIFVNSKVVEIKELRNEDQTDKYRTIRLVASEMERIGANQFIMISEAWRAPFNPQTPDRHASNSPERQEILNLVGANQSGEGYVLTVPFSRDGEEIKYGESEENGIDGVNIIQPILAIWESHCQKES
jgi:hypothetical protein